jgi:hypothetical protein
MKSLLFKTIRNFLVANLCVVAPLWMALFGGMPGQVRVQLRVDGRKPVLLLAQATTLTGTDLGVKRGGRVWGFSLRDDTAWEDLEFSLPGDLGPESVRRVEWRKWRAFVLRKDGGGLVQTNARANRYAFPDPRFDSAGFASAGWAAAVLGMELLLAVLSRFFAGRHREESVKTLLPAALGVAFALALLLQVALPLQSYLANRSAFPFALAELGGCMAVRFALFLGAGTLALLLSARCFGRWVLAPVLAFAVCVYLESGVLSIGLPDMKGDWSFFDNRFRACWDAVAWVAVFAVFCGCHPFLRRRYGTASLCAAGLFCASLLDVKVEPEADASRLIVHDFSPIETVVRSVKYAPSGNVLVFVIDSLEQRIAHAVMEDPEDGPGLKEKFAGFTEYLDNVGGGNTSLVGISNALTGDFPENASVFDYFASIYSARSVLKDFLEAGYDISMATASHGYGWSSRRGGAEDAGGRADCFQVPSTAGNAWTLAGFDRFRCLPFAAKASYAERVELSVPAGRFSDREWTVYPILRDAEVLPGGRGTFLFVHTEGVHIPILFDRTGARLASPARSDEACVEMGICIMKHLGALFDAYREKGIYDSSMIVVMADHGPHASAYPPGELPVKARPFLWIKPAGESHAFRSSRLPTGHAQLAGLLRAASRKTLTEGEIEGLLQADVRRYMWLKGGMGPEYKDYLVDREGRVDIIPGTLAESVGSMRPPKLSRRYSLGCQEMGRNNLDIVFHGVEFWPCPSWGAGTPGMDFFFRAPDPAKRYSLTLALRCETLGRKLSPDAAIEFRQAGRGAEWESLRALRRMEIVLRGLRPDADGKVAIEFRRGDALSVDVEFRQLMLEEEAEPGGDAGRE